LNASVFGLSDKWSPTYYIYVRVHMALQPREPWKWYTHENNAGILYFRSWMRCIEFFSTSKWHRSCHVHTKWPMSCLICPPWLWNTSRSTLSPCYQRLFTSVLTSWISLEPSHVSVGRVLTVSGSWMVIRCYDVFFVLSNTVWYCEIQYSLQSKFEGFCQWGVITCNVLLLDFVHHLSYEIIKLHFGRWIVLF
jgi:hypothetical protein